MTTVYTFIATRTTYATTIPSRVPLNELTRRVRDALKATDYPTRVGELRDFPLSTAIPGFLLCDGSEVAQNAFPELYAYLGDTQGTPVTATNFLIPNYVGTKTQSPTAPPQTIVAGTVNTGGTSTSPTTPGQTGGTVGGSPVSGGRPQTLNENENEF
jgi:Phage Tail Collar Domain